MAERIETVVIGAGVVGLAVARALAMGGHDVLVVESEDAIGTATSSRNSEVIHAGIYYPKDSVRARVCVAGKHRLYEYCAEHGIDHARVGKLIVATEESQLDALDALKVTAAGNGVDDLVRMGFDPEEVGLVRRRLESTHWKRELPTVAVLSSSAIGEFYLRPVDY